ncbi:MAG TPA: hypothetical protein VG146_12690 [Verrucomicrobiae bacterium]|nr:hypothetical protein [Verrucomicrobiae bacterium]
MSIITEKWSASRLGWSVANATTEARRAAVGLTAGAQEESPIGALLLDIWVLLVGQTSQDCT